MIEIRDLPAVNAVLNAISLALLVAGFAMIKGGRVAAHRNLMTAAFGVSVVFLISYLTYHFQAGDTKFVGRGWIRPVYFFILITHIILAAAVPVLAIRTLYLGFRNRVEKHRRIARFTFPIWVYVSITGVIVYMMLYRWYPAA